MSDFTAVTGILSQPFFLHGGERPFFFLRIPWMMMEKKMPIILNQQRAFSIYKI